MMEDSFHGTGEVPTRTPGEECGVEAAIGRYVYGIARGGQALELGQIGIDGNPVYAVPCGDVCAIVHTCAAQPYYSCDDEAVKAWVKTHQRVLDAAGKQFGTVIPMSFDTIIKSGDSGLSPDDVLRDWLKRDHDKLVAVLNRIAGKDEYGVQVSYDVEMVRRRVCEESIEVKELAAVVAKKSPGVAYLYQQRLEQMIKVEMGKLADEWFRNLLDGIKQHSDDVVVEKVKKTDKGKAMFLNLSCLLAGDKVEQFGQELDRICSTEGFTVRYCGPWPPYSFVREEASPTGRDG